jgi:hypothetical protein
LENLTMRGGDRTILSKCGLGKPQETIRK